MTDQPSNTNDWKACEPNLLVKHARGMHRRDLLRLAARTGGAAGCVAIVGFGGWYAYLRQQQAEQQFAGLTCSEVRELMPRYRTRQLDAKRSRVLEEHVRRCSSCAALRTELHANT